MKKILSLLLCGVLVLSLAACGTPAENDTTTQTTEPTEDTDGVKTYTCSDCGGTKTEELELPEERRNFEISITYNSLLVFYFH